MNHEDFVQSTSKFIHLSFQYFQIADYRQRTPRKMSESCRFHAFCPQFLRTTQNSLNPHPYPVNSRKVQRITQMSCISRIVPTNYMKFSQSTPMASKLQEDTANRKNSAPSAPPPGEHRKIHILYTQQTRKVTRFTHLLHIIHMYTHIFLHTCRLVLDAHF